MAATAEAFLRKGVAGAEGHNSTQETFMRPSTDSRAEGVRVNVDAHLNEVELPPRVADMFRAVGNPAREHVFNHWVLMSLDCIRERMRTLRREYGQGGVVDFAFCYAGMGHVVVCAYMPALGKVFYRVDGGANGYEREEHHQLLVQFRPADSPTFFKEAHWFETVTAQIQQSAYEPFNLPLTHLRRN